MSHLPRLCVASALLLGLSLSPLADAKTCDNACLTGIMHTYLHDMSRHDPAGLPVARDLNARENTRAMPLGEGSWQSVDQVLPGLLFADASTGEVVYAGGSKHDGLIGTLFVRLKVVDGKITESELLTRGGEPTTSGTPVGHSTAGLAEPDILYYAVVPRDRRVSHAQMIDVVKGYLQGITEHNGSIPKFSYRCDRYNAGYRWTNNPDNPPSRGGGSCGSSLNGLTGRPVVNVRIPIVDVEHGIAVALFIIPHPERRVPGATNIAEVFKIVDGKIRSTEEFGGGGTYPPSSGFPDNDD